MAENEGMNPEELARLAWIMGFGDLTMNILEPRFELGRTYATSAVTRWAETHGIDLNKLMWRHHCGDWGDLCNEDKAANEDALIHDGRIFSSYLLNDKKIYIVSEADRSMTTVLFASEY